jgi:3-phosphoshikimate 1-carboxyvinyltransferase
MTIASLADFGAAVEVAATAAGESLRVRGPLVAPEDPVAIEPDASSAGVALCAAALSDGELVVPGLGHGSRQGDVAIVEHLAAFGVAAEARADGLFARGFPTRGAALDLERTPDLAPALAAVAAGVALRAGERSLFTGLGTLPGKESSRIAVLAAGLAALGLAVDAGADRLAIGPPPGGSAGDAGPLELDAAGDHRMAFAFALCGLVREDVGVRGADAVAKSWPGFWDDMRSIGLTVFPVHAQGTGDDGDRGR